MRIAIKLSGRWWNSDYSWWRKIWYNVYIWLAKNAPSYLLIAYKWKYAHKDRSLSMLHEYDAHEERAMIRSGQNIWTVLHGYSQKPPDPTDLKRMNQFYTWCHSPAFCCVYSMLLNRREDLFLLHRVGHWWCTICFWCSFSPGNSYWAVGLVWRWNTPGPSPYDRVERHRRPSLLCETGPPACHEIWGSDNRITEYVSNCWCL